MVSITIPECAPKHVEMIVSFCQVDEGDYVNRLDSVFEIVFDKAVFTSAAPQNGIVAKLFFEEGDSVSPGSVIALLDEQVKTFYPID